MTLSAEQTKILELLEATWNQYPNLRFGQLLDSLRLNTRHNIFYADDKDIVEVIVREMKRLY